MSEITKMPRSATSKFEKWKYFNFKGSHCKYYTVGGTLLTNFLTSGVLTLKDTFLEIVSCSTKKDSIVLKSLTNGRLYDYSLYDFDRSNYVMFWFRNEYIPYNLMKLRDISLGLLSTEQWPVLKDNPIVIEYEDDEFFDYNKWTVIGRNKKMIPGASRKHNWIEHDKVEDFDGSTLLPEDITLQMIIDGECFIRVKDEPIKIIPQIGILG